MPVRRTSIAVLVAALLASLLAFAGSSSAAAPAASVAKPAAAARVFGQPPARYTIPADSYFSFPNAGKKTKFAIRNRVLMTINSTWGARRLPNGLSSPSAGTIRIATWSFKDWTIARALVAAKARGVSVQVVAAKARNAPNPEWRFLKKKLGTRLARAGHPETVNQVSFARECRGACRGRGGTPHAKYFLFTNVGPYHVKNTVIQTSMNLTKMGYEGQWNQAEVTHDPAVYGDFNTIYAQTRVGVPVAAPHRLWDRGVYTDEFFPFHANPSTDPVMRTLAPVRCTGAQVGTPGGRTRIRIINYSIYGDRGVWIAKRLRQLWNQGCDIKMIYAVSSRPVVSILRNGSGRGPIPLRQSVITNSKREIVKYNHSKWFTIMGRYGNDTKAYVTMSGSANFSLFAFTGDEQVQTIKSAGQVFRHNNNFNATWRQKTSHSPGFGIKGSEGRMTEAARIALIPEEPTWGKGIYKFLGPDGD
ncbi:phospholipase D-like domain-containing protein [Marmoricola sp. URHB0036]|uniref:phospholipase D-like domain-containing protein n=1 Tax=Marmoricola sp. URHB0036 TaxID=1298863 RepID=UPI0003FCF04B|nr:phospholipase D-like domain-containing protein [Marmoricola sp. URHB0036]